MRCSHLITTSWQRGVWFTSYTQSVDWKKTPNENTQDGRMCFSKTHLVDQYI